MASSLKNIIVIGASYVGRGTALELARHVPATHRVLLVEPHSHFHHLFALPRFSVVPGHEEKAFIPYSGVFANIPNSSNHAVVAARVTSVQPNSVNIDRSFEGKDQIPFEYLVIATGTRLTPPSMMPSDEKTPSVSFLRDHQAQAQKSKSIVLVGGGAVGVQMALDLRERYPEKDITVVQSRDRVMPQYHQDLHNIVAKAFQDAHIKLVTGSRVKVPPGGFPKTGEEFQIELTNGSTLTTNMVILATGQTPNNSLISQLAESSSTTLVNPANGCIFVKSTLQLQSSKFPHIFSLGDIADTGAHKAARPGAQQAGVVARNIVSMIESGKAEEEFTPGPAAIHLTLGFKRSVIFRNPLPGGSEPVIIEKDDGAEDMHVKGFWERHNVPVTDPVQYRL